MSSDPRSAARDETITLFGALLFTDIHLIKPDAPRLDIDIELRNGVLLLPELQEQIPEISTILVGGDVAFDATQNQYTAAAAFLRELAVPHRRRAPGARDSGQSRYRPGSYGNARSAALEKHAEAECTGRGGARPFAA